MSLMNIEHLARLIEERRVAIFCGAGVSKGSGLPDANQLKREVISACSNIKEDVDEVAQSGIPLEVVFEILSGYTDITPLLALFETGKPYLAHRLVGRLVHANFVKHVGTTNFDPHFEVYLRDFEKKQYCLCCAADHAHNERLPSLFKIHGTVPDYKSIQLTIQRVAAGRFETSTVDSLRYLFSTGPHDYVLILGYRFADNFDVNPILRSFSLRKKLIYISHKSARNQIQLNGPLPSAIQEYDVINLSVDTDWFLEELWNELAEHIGAFISVPKTDDKAWLSCVATWRQQIVSKPFLAKFIMGRLFSNDGRYGKADLCFKLVPTLTSEIVPVSRSYFLRGGAKINATEYESAGKLVKEGLALLPDIEKLTYSNEEPDRELIEVAALGTARAGTIEMYLGQHALHEARDTATAIDRYEAAEHYFTQAVKLATKIGREGDLTYCALGLGAIHMNWADCCNDKEEKDLHLQKALEQFRSARQTASVQGDAYSQADAQDGIGKVFRRQGRVSEAIRVHEDSLNMAEDLVDERRKSIKFLSLAKDYQNLPDGAAKELEYRQKAQPILVRIGDTRTARENQAKIWVLQHGSRVASGN
jgi:tetratricopeptide (TPR) repeat protein